ncbi:MAG: aminotransferase class IV [Planctomycetota bacterium]|jgi:branched-subunit amino acid aminotransferase/4-amino-4-deoxychorismate lyase
MSEPIAWFNGQFIPYSQAALPVGDMGVVAGATVTEMIRTFGHQPFRLDQHLDRLDASLELLDFPTRPSRTDLQTAITEVVHHNAQLISESSDLGIIAFVTAGQNPTYLGPDHLDQVTVGSVCVHTFELPFAFWADLYSRGGQLTTVTVAPLPNNSVTPRAKHRNRLHWWRADREAGRKAAGSRALLQMPDGQFTETSSGNLLVVQGQTISTPPPEIVLGGISKAVTQELAVELGFEWLERPIYSVDLQSADEVLTTSTPYCILPTARLNQNPIGAGYPRPVFTQLIQAWDAHVGIDIRQQSRDCTD